MVSLGSANHDSREVIALLVTDHAGRQFQAAGHQDGVLVWHPVRNWRRGKKAPN